MIYTPPLSAHQLEAFTAVARTQSFSRAAALLKLTQPALSQRVLNLESELGTALFTRTRREVRLTEAGQRLLRYCRTKDSLEHELRNELGSGHGAAPLSGTIRLAGFSSVMRSLVLPSLAPLARANDGVRLQLLTAELRDLPGLLERGEADFALLDRHCEKPGLESIELGRERYVLATAAAKGRDRPETILDHDPDDQVTEMFFRRQPGAQSRKAPAARSYLDEIYSLLDGVALGLGRAVVPEHLMENDKRLRAVPGFKPLELPIVLHRLAQPYYSRLHEATIAALHEGFSAMRAAPSKSATPFR